MIKVGVNEPVYVSKAEKTDQGSIQIFFKEAGGEEKKKLSMAEQMNESSDSSGSTLGETGFILFPPNTKVKDEAREPEKVIADMIAIKNQCHHILRRYVTSDKIRWELFKNTIPVKTDDELAEKIMDETYRKQVYANIVDQFIEMANRFKIFDPTKQGRLMLVRQSADKHFGRLRDKFLDDQPFFEDIVIPKATSKLWIKASNKTTKFFEPDADGYVPNFNDFEMKNGKDNPMITAAAQDSNAASPEEAAKVENLFGNGAPQAAVDFSQPAETAKEA